MGSDLSGSFDSPERPRSEALGRVCSTSEGNRGDLRFRESRIAPPALDLVPQRAKKIDSGLESNPGPFFFHRSLTLHRPSRPSAPRVDTVGGWWSASGADRRPLFTEVGSDYREKIRPNNPCRNCCSAAENPYFFGVCVAVGALGIPCAVGTTVWRFAPTKHRFSASFRAAAILSREAFASSPSLNKPPFSPGMFL